MTHLLLQSLHQLHARRKNMNEKFPVNLEVKTQPELLRTTGKAGMENKSKLEGQEEYVEPKIPIVNYDQRLI